MLKAAVISGTRAEYGLLRPLLMKLKNSSIELQLIVTGAHLRKEYGSTVTEIEKDGFDFVKIDIIRESIPSSMACAIESFGKYFADNKIDILIVLGDRYEIFAAVISAALNKIKIAHIHGGELTYGAVDDMFRHCITKMSHLHFTACEEYKNRVINLGEIPENVYNVGALGVENIISLPLLSRTDLFKKLDIQNITNYCVATFHPVTLTNNSLNDLQQMLFALEKYKISVIFTKANADECGSLINAELEKQVNLHENWYLYDSLGITAYLSALKYCDFEIGNSSSGILEAPYFYVPSINIGSRQKGRICASSVINCNTDTESIYKAILSAQDDNFKNSIKNQILPFGDGNSSSKIFDVICKEIGTEYKLKEFYDTYLRH